MLAGDGAIAERAAEEQDRSGDADAARQRANRAIFAAQRPVSRR